MQEKLENVITAERNRRNHNENIYYISLEGFMAPEKNSTVNSKL